MPSVTNSSYSIKAHFGVTDIMTVFSFETMEQGSNFTLTLTVTFVNLPGFNITPGSYALSEANPSMQVSGGGPGTMAGTLNLLFDADQTTKLIVFDGMLFGLGTSINVNNAVLGAA